MRGEMGGRTEREQEKKGKNMEQLKCYLSLQRNLGNVLLIGEEQDIRELTQYLEREPGVDSVRATAGNDAEKLREQVRERHIDTILFACGCAKAVKELEKIPDMGVRYLVGLIDGQEDYFALWESYREQVEHICLVRERGQGGGSKRDAAPCEALIWDRAASSTELSVIVPVYNVRPYLKKCLDTLTAWRAPYVEYLFVDDGSTDGSGDVIEEYAQNDTRIRLIRKENGGCASARNCGLRQAAGRYVGFVDGDDFVDGRMYYKLLKRAMMGNYELAYCGYQEYDEDSGTITKIKDDCLQEPYLTGTYRADQVQRLMIRTRVAIWRCIYKRAFLEEKRIGFHEGLPRFDDLPFKIESGFCAKSAVCVPEYLYYYRQGRAGQDVECRDERLFVHFEIFRILDAAVLPRKNRRLIDYLQIVKLHTHGYALGKIDRKYYASYLRMARRQLDETAGTMRTLLLMMAYGGKNNIGWYLKSRIWCNGKRTETEARGNGVK